MPEASQTDPRVSGHVSTVLSASLVSLIIGFAFHASAPMGISEAETQRWYRLHEITFDALRIVGGLLVVAGLMLMSGRIATLRWAGWSLVVFSLAMLAKGGVYAWESYAIGSFDIFAVVMLILAGIGFFEARLMLCDYRAIVRDAAPPS